MNAPTTFQSLINDVFRPYLRRFVLVFFDKILVYSRSISEHTKHMHLVLQQLTKNILFENFKKCEFGKEKLAYSGHVIFASGVEVDYDKIKNMVEWQRPKNL